MVRTVRGPPSSELNAMKGLIPEVFKAVISAVNGSGEEIVIRDYLDPDVYSQVAHTRTVTRWSFLAKVTSVT